MFKLTYSSPLASSIHCSTNISSRTIAKLDSGATNHYFKQAHLKILKNVQKLSKGSNVHLPNNTSIPVTHEGYLNLHTKLKPQMSKTYVLPQLTNESLFSIDQFCDQDCAIIF